MGNMETLELGDCLTATLPTGINLCYMDPPYNTGTNFGAFNDDWIDTNSYLDYLVPRIKRCWDHLTEGGNLIVHADWHAIHYIKVAVDGFAGQHNFHNEIIWAYNSGGASRRHLSRKHDTLLWWAKGENWTFNVHREPYATPNVQGRTGFHPEGRMLTDVWHIPFISTTSKERTGYPTQKPVALLERVINVFSHPGDLVCDPFCGSGTTGVAAHKLGRDAYLVDTNPDALAVARHRLSGLGGA
jgi:site-specific DNA-methyltransferase (adenine-specific)